MLRMSGRTAPRRTSEAIESRERLKVVYHDLRSQLKQANREVASTGDAHSRARDKQMTLAGAVNSIEKLLKGDSKL